MLWATKCVSDTRQPFPPSDYSIDATRDRLIALARVSSWYEQRTGRKLHRTVPYRWRHRGVQTADGTLIRLPTVRLGGMRYTSEEAIAWWTAAIDGGTSA